MFFFLASLVVVINGADTDPRIRIARAVDTYLASFNDDEAHLALYSDDAKIQTGFELAPNTKEGFADIYASVGPLFKIYGVLASPLHFLHDNKVAAELTFFFEPNDSNMCSWRGSVLSFWTFSDDMLITELIHINSITSRAFDAAVQCKGPPDEAVQDARTALFKAYSYANVRAAEALVGGDSTGMDAFILQSTEDVMFDDALSAGPAVGRAAVRKAYEGLAETFGFVAIYDRPSYGKAGPDGAFVAWRESLLATTKTGCVIHAPVICYQRVTEAGLIASHSCYYDARKIFAQMACQNTHDEL